MPSSATTVVHPPQPLQQQQQQQQAQLSQPQQQQPTATHLGALSLGASPTLGVATTLGSPSPLGAASPVGATSLSSTVVPTMGATAGQVVSAASVGTCQATPSAIAAPPPLGNMQQPLGAASLGAAVPLGSTMGSGPLGATTVRAPLMVAVDSTSGRQHQQQQQLVSPSALHTQQTGFTSTGLTAHSNSVSDGVATSQPSAATQPYSCVTPSNLLSPTHSSTPPNHNTSPRPSILRKRTFERWAFPSCC